MPCLRPVSFPVRARSPDAGHFSRQYFSPASKTSPENEDVPARACEDVELGMQQLGKMTHNIVRYPSQYACQGFQPLGIQYMITVSLTKAQRRRLQAITPRIERMTTADSLFFERQPFRRYRVRLAHRAEIEERRIIDGLPPIPDGFRAFVAVHCPVPGIRLRAIAVAPEGAETDLPEPMARAIFERVAGRFA
jgi:hypothetical protein